MKQRALELFSDAPCATRLHTRLRWWWCPFPVIEEALPATGDVLEIGCGHGLLSLFLGITGPQRAVVGVDIDAAKIAEADRAVRHLRTAEADVTFRVVDAAYRPTGEWDAVVIADVLYLMPEDIQHEMLTAACRAVRDGGVVVVKEMGLRPRWKATWNRVQETVATRVARVTDSVGTGLTFVHPEVMSAWLSEPGLVVSHQPVDRGYPWPHHLVVGRRPVQP